MSNKKRGKITIYPDASASQRIKAARVAAASAGVAPGHSSQSAIVVALVQVADVDAAVTHMLAEERAAKGGDDAQ